MYFSQTHSQNFFSENVISSNKSIGLSNYANCAFSSHSASAISDNRTGKTSPATNGILVLLSKHLSDSHFLTSTTSFPLPGHNTVLCLGSSTNAFFSGAQYRHVSQKAGKRRILRREVSRTLSTQNADGEKGEEEKEEKPLTLYQRFKKTYKEHGKVLVAVHLATSSVWFGCFYTAARW